MPPDPAPPSADLPAHDLDTEKGRAALKKALTRVDPAEVFVTLGSNAPAAPPPPSSRRNPRGAIACAEGADEASLRSCDPRDAADGDVLGGDEAARAKLG